MLIQIKKGSQENYLRAFNQLRDFFGDQLESRTPTEHKLLQFVQHLREKIGMALSSLWTIYSMINSVLNLFNLKQYCRVTILLKSFDVDIIQKANVFSTRNIHQFILDADSSTPYWLLERQFFVWLIMYGMFTLCFGRPATWSSRCLDRQGNVCTQDNKTSWKGK